VGGRKGWRLPTIEELASLIDPTQTNPALPIGHPFINVQSDRYWSASTVVGDTDEVSDDTSDIGGDTDEAWDVRFNYGYVSTYSKSSSGFVWCVRGGS
jgi:hypothetical protein